MAKSTVNLQKMKIVAEELDKIHAAMSANKKTLDETIGQLPKVWQGEAAKAYQQAYKENVQDFVLLAEAIRNCSVTLTTVAGTYGKADMAAAEAIKTKMTKG